jgi:hypothetical protein
VVQQPPTGCEARSQPPEVVGDPTCADVFEHADRADRVEPLAVQVPVVLESDLDPILEPPSRTAGSPSRPARDSARCRRRGHRGAPQHAGRAIPIRSRRPAAGGRCRCAGRASDRPARTWRAGPPRGSCRRRRSGRTSRPWRARAPSGRTRCRRRSGVAPPWRHVVGSGDGRAGGLLDRRGDRPAEHPARRAARAARSRRRTAVRSPSPSPGPR